MSSIPTPTIEIEGFRIKLVSNGDGTYSPVVANQGGPSNRVQMVIPSTYTTNSDSTVSTGIGSAAISPQALGELFLTGNVTISAAASSLGGTLAIYRTTGDIPAAGSPVGVNDVPIAAFGAVILTSFEMILTFPISIFDTELTNGVSYKYYFAIVAAIGGGTNTISLVSGGAFQVTEL